MEKGSSHQGKNLRHQKRKQWLWRGKWRGQGAGNEFMFSTISQKDTQGWKQIRISLGWSHNFLKNKQNLSLVQYETACLATKVAVIAETAAKTSALLHEACVKQHLPRFYPCYYILPNNETSLESSRPQFHLEAGSYNSLLQEIWQVVD